MRILLAALGVFSFMRSPGPTVRRRRRAQRRQTTGGPRPIGRASKRPFRRRMLLVYRSGVRATRRACVDVESGYAGGRGNGQLPTRLRRQHRPCRGDSHHLRPEQDQLRPAAGRLLRRPRPDAAQSPGRTTWARSTARRSSMPTTSKSGRPRRRSSNCRQAAFRRPIVTTLEPLVAFYPAEGDHQDFARRFPFKSYIQSHAVPPASNVRLKHPELVKPGP